MIDDRSSACLSPFSSRDAESRLVPGPNRIRFGVTVPASLADAGDVSPLEVAPVSEVERRRTRHYGIAPNGA